MNSDIKYWILKGHKLFSTLSNSQIKELCVIKKYQKAKKGEIVYFITDGIQRVYILEKGMIKIISLDHDGNEIIKDIIHQGDLFGEIHLDKADGTATEYAQALSSEIRICTFKLQDLQQLLEKNSELALSYTKFVGLKLKRLHNRYTNLFTKDVRTRLTLFLKEWAEREGKFDDGSYILPNYLTQEDLAKIICSSRQTVAETMNKLQSEGVLIYDRKILRIKDIDALK